MGNPIKQLLDDPCAGLVVQEVDRTLAVQRRGRPPQPGPSLGRVSKGLLGQRRQRRDPDCPLKFYAELRC